MKKTKWLQRAWCALLTAALAFTPMLFGCDDGSGGGGENSDEKPKIEFPADSGANAGDSSLTGSITVDNTVKDKVPETTAAPEAVVAGNYFPASGSNTAPADTVLMLPKATVARTGNLSVKIYEGATATGTPYDEIKSHDETYNSINNSNGAKADLTVKGSLIVEVGDNVIIKPKKMLKWNQQYFVEIDAGLIGTGAHSWTFTTKAEPTISGNTIQVGGDSADYATIEGAFKYLMDNSASGDWTINVAQGFYYNRPAYYGSANVTIVGQGGTDGDYGAEVVSCFINGQPWNNGSRVRTAFIWQGGNLLMKNITLQNAFVRENSSNDSCEAIYFDSDKDFVAYNCSFKGHQDTLILGNGNGNGGRIWFYKSYVEGDVDFIWGYAGVALFEKCLIHCLFDSIKSGDHSTYIFASRSPSPDTEKKTNTPMKGFVLYDCDVLIDTGATAYYGRNSGSDSQGSVINCRFQGEGTLSSALWKSAANCKYTDPMGIGAVAYKDYGNYMNGTLVDTSKRTKDTFTLSKFIKEREYNGRDVILNRNYDVKAEKYGSLASDKQFDVATYANALGFTPEEDPSKNNIFIDPMFTNNLVGGMDVELSASNLAGPVSSPTWELDAETNATIDASGKVTANSGVKGFATVTATSGENKGTAFVYVIPEVIPVKTVKVTAAERTLPLYGMTTLTIAVEGADGKVPTYNEVVLTSSSPKIKFINSEGKPAATVTTSESTVKAYATGIVDTSTITVTSEHGGTAAEPAPVTATTAIGVNQYVAEWTPASGDAQVKTDVQNGNNGAFNTMIIDATTNNKVAPNTSKTAKMSVTAGASMQTRRVILYIPIDRSATIKVYLDPAKDDPKSGEGVKGVDFDATTKTYTITQAYASAIDGSTLKSMTIGKGDGSAGTLAKKYAKVEFDVSDVYVAKIERIYEAGSTSMEGEETGAPESKAYNFYPASMKEKDDFTYTSDDGFLTAENIYHHDTTHGWATKDYTKVSKINVTIPASSSASTKISVIGCQYGQFGNVSLKVGNTVIATKKLAEVAGECGAETSFTYKATEETVVTLEFAMNDNETYIHGVKYEPYDKDSIPTYTVTFDGNNASATGVPEAVTVEEGQKVAKPADPELEGNIFDGWFTAATGGTEFNFATAPTADITLYAHWHAGVKVLEEQAIGTAIVFNTGKQALTKAYSGTKGIEYGVEFDGTSGDIQQNSDNIIFNKDAVIKVKVPEGATVVPAYHNAGNDNYTISARDSDGVVSITSGANNYLMALMVVTDVDTTKNSSINLGNYQFCVQGHYAKGNFIIIDTKTSGGKFNPNSSSQAIVNDKSIIKVKVNDGATVTVGWYNATSEPKYGSNENLDGAIAIEDGWATIKIKALARPAEGQENTAIGGWDGNIYIKTIDIAYN